MKTLGPPPLVGALGAGGQEEDSGPGGREVEGRRGPSRPEVIASQGVAANLISLGYKGVEVLLQFQSTSSNPTSCSSTNSNPTNSFSTDSNPTNYIPPR